MNDRDLGQHTDPATPAIAWESVQVIGYDLMDTLIYDPFREAIAEVTGMDLETLGRLRDPSAYHEFERDELTEAEFGERFFPADSPHRLDVVALRDALRAGYRFLPGIEALLEETSQICEIVVMSNYPRWYDYVRERFSLDRFVDSHQPSYLVGSRKPQATYYEGVAAAVGREPKEILFIDDRQKNIDGAWAVGMPALLFEGASSLRADLQPLLARDRS